MDSNKTYLLCSPQCLVVQAPKRIRSVDKFVRLVPGSDLVKFPFVTLPKTTKRIVLKLGQKVPLNVLLCNQTWPPLANLEFPCYRIASETTEPIWWNLVRMFPSISRYANTENNSDPSTNMAAVGHLGFSLLSHLLSWFKWNLAIMFASVFCCASTKTNLVYRQIWLVSSRLKLKEICYYMLVFAYTQRPLGRLFWNLSSCASAGPSTNMAAVGLMDFLVFI